MKVLRRSAGFLILVFMSAPGIGSAQSSARSSGSSSPMHLKQVAYIKASNTEAGAHFGSGGSDTEYSGNALAISGDGNTLAVGAPSVSSAAKGINGDQNDHSLFGAGAVYVFTRRGDDWVQQAYIKASNPKQSSRFGSTIALSADGNVMAVAAH